MKKIKFVAILFVLLAGAVCAFAAGKTIHSVSGDGQTGIRGYPLKDGFVVRVLDQDGNAAQGVRINFSVIRSINEEHKKMPSSLMPASAYTNENGYAKTLLTLGKNSPDEIIVVASSEEIAGNVIFKTLAFNKNWIIMTIVNVAGGLALLLFGMAFINGALQKAAGQKFRTILTSVTSSKYKGVVSGFSLTTLNQSSSATMLMTVSLVSTGLLSFYQSMSISLGASIGSTVTAQLVAFRLSNFALPIIAFGYLISFVSGGKRISEIGDAIFGFGILFFGMKLMSDAMVPITLNPVFLDFIAQIQSPAFAILTGVAITIIMQSSGAVV
ncbi:MAG: Na/Pi symporter, partial [Endomicrobia bacterium]|nr:Na/Pi symporter [Endomicrobiia bacterium]